MKQIIPVTLFERTSWPLTGYSNNTVACIVGVGKRFSGLMAVYSYEVFGTRLRDLIQS